MEVTAHDNHGHDNYGGCVKTLRGCDSSDDGDPHFFRRASGSLLSPPGDTASSEHSGFYLLKRDSHRRESLYKILTDHSDPVSGQAGRNVSNTTSNVLYLGCVKLIFWEYPILSECPVLSDSTSGVLCPEKLKEEVENENAEVEQLHDAVYIFQEV
ncbi:MAP3K15, partial [Cordylochernes scorpioides]